MAADDSGPGRASVPAEQLEKPTCIRQDLWERFKAVEKRTDEVTTRSTERRIEELKKSIVDRVKQELGPEDLESIKEYLPEEQIKKKRRKKKHQKDTDSKEVELLPREQQAEWNDVKQYLDVNKHLDKNLGSKPGPECGLEKKINMAIEQMEFDKAEQLSDHLATREFGSKIAGAFAARDYAKQKKTEEESLKVKRKRKLNWGMDEESVKTDEWFEHKQRWEMKGNM